MRFSSILATIRRQWIVVAAVMAVGLVAFFVLLPHFHKFTATSTMLASNAPSGSSAVLDPQKDPIASAVGLNDLQTLATSDIVLDRVAAKLHLSKKQTDALPAEVKARAVFNSDILPIAVTDPDPAVAVDAANGVASELAAYSERIATGRYDELIANLRGQIAERRKDLAKIDARIQDVSSGDFYVTPEGGTSAIATRLVALAQQQQQLEANVTGDQAAAAVTAEQPGLSHSLARQEIIAQDPAITAQRAQLGKDISSLNYSLSGYTLTFPGLKNYILQVRRETAAVERAENRTARDPGESASYVAALIQANKARATLANDQAQLASVRSQMDELRSHLSGTGADEGSTIAELRRSRAAGEDVFTDLSQRLARASADRAQAASIGSVVVIDHAVGASPALLGRPLVLGAGLFVIFLWLAVSLAYIIDGYDDRMRTPESIGKLYGFPVFTPVG